MIATPPPSGAAEGEHPGDRRGRRAVPLPDHRPVDAATRYPMYDVRITRRPHRLGRRPRASSQRREDRRARARGRPSNTGTADEPRDRGSRDRDRHPGRRAGRRSRSRCVLLGHADQRGRPPVHEHGRLHLQPDRRATPLSQQPGRARHDAADDDRRARRAHAREERPRDDGARHARDVHARRPQRGHRRRPGTSRSSIGCPNGATGRHLRRRAHRDHRARVPGRRRRRRSRARSSQGTDFSVACTRARRPASSTLTMLSAAAVVGPDQRLIVTYQTQLDADSAERRRAHQRRRRDAVVQRGQHQSPNRAHASRAR